MDIIRYGIIRECGNCHAPFLCPLYPPFRGNYWGERKIHNLIFVSYEKFPTFDNMNTEQKEKDRKPEPTKSELEILRVLWEYGTSTVRFVNDKLNEQREVNYTTTLKLMQIMVEKGILRRDESNMKHAYSVAEEEQETKAHLLEKFVDTLYKGSASKLVVQLLGNKKTTKKELQEIKDMLKKLEE